MRLTWLFGSDDPAAVLIGWVHGRILRGCDGATYVVGEDRRTACYFMQNKESGLATTVTQRRDGFFKTKDDLEKVDCVLLVRRNRRGFV